MCSVMAFMGFAGQMAGGAMKAQAAKSEGAYQAKQAAINADLADRAAADATDRADRQAGRMTMQASGRIAQGEAETAASNISLAGTPARALADERWLSAEDAAVVRSSGARAAWGDRVKAGQFREEGANALQSASSEATADILGGIMGGTSSAFSYAKGGGWLGSDKPGDSGMGVPGGGIPITEQMVAPRQVSGFDEEGQPNYAD